MTKEELKKEANEYADDYATPDLDCSFRAYMFEASKEGYLAGAEPREKQIDELKAQIKVLEQNLEDTEICENGLKNRIAELEDKLANADYQLEGRDLEIKELKAQIEREKNLNQCMSDNNEQLRELIGKMKCCFTCEYQNKFVEAKCGKCDNYNKWKLKELRR